MATSDPRNRLQPALLDRLTDESRGHDDEGDARRRNALRYAGWRPKRGAAPAGAATPATAAPPAQAGLDPERVMSRSQLRQAVLRDLGALFNAVTPLDVATVDAHPGLAGTVLDFGLPPLAGQLASKLDVHALERLLRQTILRFEPRLLAETLRVRALEATSVLDTHNVVEFEITGHLWSEPVPLEVLLRTQIDLEAGQVRVVDAGAPGRLPALSQKG